MLEQTLKQAKKSPSLGLGLNPPRRRWRRQTKYMKGFCAKQVNLHYGIEFHNAKY
jgi:hypothetical protein